MVTAKESAMFITMNEIPGEGKSFGEDLAEVGSGFNALIATIQEPLLILDSSHRILAASEAFNAEFEAELDLTGVSVKDPQMSFSHPDLDLLLDVILPEKQVLKRYPISYNNSAREEVRYMVNAQRVSTSAATEMIYLSFSKEVPEFRKLNSVAGNFVNILAHVPAMICVLKGPDHTFDVANKRYIELIGRDNIIGKTLREVLPEAEKQGFLEILDTVYSTGEPFIGTEVPLDLTGSDGKTRKSYVDFLYQPTRDSDGGVDGIFVHAVDVSEQVIARKKLEESRERLSILVEAMPAIVWMSDKDGKTAHLNKNWYRYTGQSGEEASEWGWLQAVYPEHREMLKETCERSHRTYKSFSVSFRLYHKEDEYRWVINTGEPKFDAEGNFEGMIGTIIDTHEEKLKEEQLRENEHRIRTIVEEATVATAVYLGEEMTIELANEAMIALWGKDSSVIGKNLKEAIPELEGQPFLELLREVYTTGRTYWGKEDKVDLMVDGELKRGYFNFTYKPLRNEKGEIYGILNMALEVSEMVESKLLLKESESHFRQMADLMPEKVVNTDPNGDIIYFNQNWLSYTGLSSDQLKEDGWAQFIHPDERNEFEQSWRKSLDTGNDFEMELRILDRFAKYKWHLSRAEAVRDDKGTIKMWIGNNTEIQKLKEEEKRKEDFLKMVSHELKTPVTSIKGYVQLLLSLLKEGSSPDISKLPVRPSLERIDHQIQRLTRLIAEMLDISRIEENKLKLQKTRFNINTLVDETVQDIRYTSTNHLIRVQHENKCTIYADRDRIGQVLINIITNAIKYSPEKKEIEVVVTKGTKDSVSVVVRDEGIGIDPQKHRSIFKRFFRAGGKSEETYSGFGIGLFLAKEIIQRHGGSIEVNSELGMGAEFKFTLAAINDKSIES